MEKTQSLMETTLKAERQGNTLESPHFSQHIPICSSHLPTLCCCCCCCWSRFSRVRLCATPPGSPPGSPIPETLQARTLEWVAISFFNAWRWKVKVKSLSHVRLLATPWTAAYQAPLPMGFSRQEYGSGLPLPSPANPLSVLKKKKKGGRKV